MNGLPYYKAYPRDFIEGTIGLPFEVKAAYRLVLDLIYMQGGNLPDDARYVSGMLGLSVRKWNDIRGQLVAAGKLAVNGEFLTNYRAIKELETLSSFQDKQAKNRSRPNKNKDLQSPRFDHTESDTESEEKKEEKKEEKPLRGGADAPPPSGQSVEVQVYAVGKRVLGKSAGGQITKLRKLFDYQDADLLAFIQDVLADKQSPAEYAAAFIRKNQPENRALRGAINFDDRDQGVEWVDFYRAGKAPSNRSYEYRSGWTPEDEQRAQAEKEAKVKARRDRELAELREMGAIH